jgi:hypothetical protein
LDRERGRDEDEDEDESVESVEGVGAVSNKSSGGAVGWGKDRPDIKDKEKDLWADSSDEDEEYSKARRLLGRVMGKGKDKSKGKGKK